MTKTPVVWNKELYAKQLVRRNITSPLVKWNLTNMCLLSKMRLRGKRLLRYFPQKNTVLVNDEVSSKLSIVCKDAQFCTHRKGDPRTVQAQKLVYILHIKTKTARPIPIVSDKGNFRRTFQGKPEGAGSGGQALSKVSKVHAQKSVDQKMLDVTNMEKKDLEEIGNRIVNIKDAKAGPVTSPSHSPKHKKARTTHSAAHAASAAEEEAEPARSRGDGAEASKSSKVQEKQEHPRREKSRGYKPVLVTARKIPEYRIEDADKFVKGKLWIVLDPGESTAFTGLLVEPDGSCFELRFGAGLSRFIDWKKKKVDSARSAMDLEKDENERKAKTNEYQRTLHELEATKNKARHTIVNHITALADVVLVPRLAVARMTQRKARGKPMGTDFRRRMLGLGVATMTDLLQSKCENTGIKYFTVSEYLTSKGCVCGAVHGSLGFSRHFKCPKCHATRHRDLGACFMILLDFLIAMRRIAAEGSGSSDVGGAGPPKPKRKSHQNSKAPPPGATSKADTKAPEDEARRKASIVKGNKKKVDEEDEEEDEEEERKRKRRRITAKTTMTKTQTAMATLNTRPTLMPLCTQTQTNVF